MPKKDESLNDGLNVRNSAAFIILSCDKYRDLWEPGIDRLFAYWPTIPFDVYVATNRTICQDRRVRSLLSGDDLDWTSSIRAAVSQIAHPYVLLWFDDAFLAQPLQNETVRAPLLWALTHRVAYLRLRSIPRPNEKITDNIGRLGEGAPYRVSCFGALWRRQTFLDLLVDGESAADFEMNGTIRSYAHQDFYGVYRSPIPYIHGVVQGRWLRSSYRRLANQGVVLSQDRPIMSRVEEFCWKVKELKASIAVNLPPGWANAIFALKKRLVSKSAPQRSPKKSTRACA